MDDCKTPVQTRKKADFRGTVSFASLNAHNSVVRVIISYIDSNEYEERLVINSRDSGTVQISLIMEVISMAVKDSFLF